MRYPAAEWLGNGQSGGSFVGLPWRVVLHTTETEGVPSYKGGSAAPHLSYDTAHRKWVQHTDFDTAARALLNVAGGVQTNRANCLQVEIICYSAKTIADRKSSRLWVGQLNDHHFEDLREFLEWTFEEFGVQDIWPAEQALSSAQANRPNFRMSKSKWEQFNGVCGHQHVPENKHWDPGAIAWARLIGTEMGHPSSDFKEFTAGHNIGEIPSWAPWDEYVEAGGSSVKESGTWASTRADMAWFWNQFVRPLQEKVVELEDRIKEFEESD